jgi:hypothetical protein
MRCLVDMHHRLAPEQSQQQSCDAVCRTQFK